MRSERRSVVFGGLTLQFVNLAAANLKYNPFNHESTTTTRLQEHNDKYIYKSVAFLVQYISKDILSLQWPLSIEKGRLFQFVRIIFVRIIAIIVLIKRFLHFKPLEVRGNESDPENSPPTSTPLLLLYFVLFCILGL